MDKFEEALDVIDDLLQTISWLGGDAYEMEATAKSTDAGYAFLEKHRPPVPEPEPVSPQITHPTWNENTYVLRSEQHLENARKVYAWNKKIARKLLGVSEGEVICIQISEQQRQRS
jgi:hypothetical protein